MARRAVLGGGSLNPFGGAGVDFGAFDIGGTDRESNLILTRVEVEWEAGRATDSEYLAALEAYATTLTANTSQRLNADARVEQMRYRVERDVLSEQVDSGVKTLHDLLAYDKGKLAGLVQDSQEYRQRLNTYQSTQGQLYSDLEQETVRLYNDGKMTTAQLNAWYLARRQDGLLADNPDITEAIDNRLHELDGRLIEERDAKTLDDFQRGKMAPATFISYATAARARYAPGTNDYADWTERLNDAHDKSIETALLYRYDLSQQYAQLAKFVQSSSAPKGGTSTSKSTRTVLGADGKWHTVTTTSTKATAPSKSEVVAYRQRQIEVADAKAQMKQIASKIAGVGGFTSTDNVIGYYQKQLGKFAKGSDEWYAVQGKLDQLSDRKHAETVLAKQGIRISYPGTSGSGGASSAGAGSSKAAGGGTGSSSRAAVSDTRNLNVDSFMAALAKVESGGRYSARNKSSGAYGKYQIMPANWPGWAQKYLGNANAPQNPENQEKVAKAKMLDLYKWLGDWRAVAHWWLTGGSNKDTHLNPSAWSGSSRKYVDKVMGGLGLGPTSGSTLTRNATGPAGGVKVAGTGSAKAKPLPSGRDEGPLRIIVGESRPGPKGAGGGPVTKNVNFPTNLDGEAFKKFYAQYEAAFKSGATEFSVDTGSGSVHYWIGDDALERIEGMRELDGLRVELFREKMNAYSGTPSEITAANQFDGAIEDAAKHEIMILDTFEQKGTSTGAPEKNVAPIGMGIALLDKTVAAISEHIKLADAAMKRGDITTAYSLYQMAADLRAGKDELIARYSAAGRNAVTAIERAYGVSRTEALGSEGATQLQKDLDRLATFGTELEEALSAGSEGLSLLQNVIKKDSQGNPMFDERGPTGQLTLADNWHFELKANGTVEPVMTAASGYDPQTRKQTHDIEGMVRIDYLSGNSTVAAYAKYNVGTVGYIQTADGTRVPVKGKTFTRRRPDGTDELWVEDPFRPGKWSSTAITYNAGSGFKAIPGQGGETVFEFAGLKDSGRGNGAMTADGFTYHLKLDPKSGTYVLYRSKPGGLFSQEIVDEELGSLAEGSLAAAAFTGAGFHRDLTGLTAEQRTFANLGSPFVGGSAQQYKEWRTNFQNPFKPMAGSDSRQALLDEQRLARGLRAAPTPIDPQSLYAAERGLAPTGHSTDSREDLLAEQSMARGLRAAAALDKPLINKQGGVGSTPYGPSTTAIPKLRPIPSMPAVSRGPSRPKMTAQQRAAEINRVAASRADAARRAKAAADKKAAALAAAKTASGYRPIGHGPLE